MSDNVEKSLGNVEGQLSLLVTAVSSLHSAVSVVQIGVASIQQDNLTCHADRTEYNKRITSLEKNQNKIIGGVVVVGAILSAAFAQLKGWL